jgi:hypothetical protein
MSEIVCAISHGVQRRSAGGYGKEQGENVDVPKK